MVLLERLQASHKLQASTGDAGTATYYTRPPSCLLQTPTPSYPCSRPCKHGDLAI